jgi:hypothetical protein
MRILLVQRQSMFHEELGRDSLLSLSLDTRVHTKSVGS